MSWWEVVGGVIGDEPADAFGAAVAAITPFDLARTLAAADAALRANAADLVADPDAVGGTLTAVFLDGRTVVAASAEAAPVDAFAAALRKITGAYFERFERPPRLAEVLATLAFIVRGRETEAAGDAPLLSHITYRR